MSDEERARFEVLLERIESKVELISEGHGALNNRLDEIEAKVDKVSGNVTLLAIKISKIDTDVSVLRSKVVKVEDHLAKIDTRVGRIEDHLGLNGAPKPKRRPIKK